MSRESAFLFQRPSSNPDLQAPHIYYYSAWQMSPGRLRACDTCLLGSMAMLIGFTYTVVKGIVGFSSLHLIRLKQVPSARVWMAKTHSSIKLSPWKLMPLSWLYCFPGYGFSLPARPPITLATIFSGNPITALPP